MSRSGLLLKINPAQHAKNRAARRQGEEDNERNDSIDKGEVESCFEKDFHIPGWLADSGRPGPVFVLTAAQHGNEGQGSEAIRRLIELSREKLVKGKIIGVPFTNLAAVRCRRPHLNMGPEQPYAESRGHDMNKIWPGSNNGNDTSRAAFSVYERFIRGATHVMDIHFWEGSRAPALISRDTRFLRELALKMASRFVILRPPHLKESLSRLHLCGGAPVGVGYECSGQYAFAEEEVNECFRAAFNMAVTIGAMKGPLKKGHTPVILNEDVSRNVFVKAPHSGLYVKKELAPGAAVKKGNDLGILISDRTLETRMVSAPADGFLRMHGVQRPDIDVSLSAQHPYVTRGETLAIT